MRLGLLETLGTAASLVFAIPLGVYALERLFGGETALGAAFLVVALLMVALPRYLTTPGDIPGEVAERAVDGLVADEEAGEHEREE